MGFLGWTGWLVYQLSMALGLLLAAPFLLARRGSHYLTTLRGRLGFHGPSTTPAGAVWIHAVSVGEVAVAATLIRNLAPDLPLVVTTVTPTGQARARALFADTGRATVTYLPFDLGFAVNRFYRRFAPAALILIEGDYWPLVLRAARRRGVPVAVVNGRVGETSGARMRKLPWLGRRLFFAGIERFCVQTEEDRRRLEAAGALVARVRVTGNLKFDSPEPPAKPELESTVRRLAAGRPILLAGSTMLGEEEKVLDAFAQLGAGERALLVLAPRHPERFDGAARLAREAGLDCVRRSRLGADTEAGDVLLLDTLGELAALYRVADVAFIGGTLVPTGGHNPLEPAHFDTPIVVGSSMHNFRQMAELFDSANAWGRVADPEQLADLWRQWIDDPSAAREVGERGGELLAANRGAVERTLEQIEPYLPGLPGA